jgi:hypothetical protein
MIDIVLVYEQETFFDLLRSPGHWLFEIFLMAIFDGIIGALAWPFLKSHWIHHRTRDKKDGY